MKKKSHW